MNAKRRFLISFVAYLVYFVLLFASLGTLNSYLEVHPELVSASLPGWVGIVVFAALLMCPLPVLLVFFYHTPRWKKEVQKNGRLAPAQILSARDSGVSNGDSAAASFYVDLTVRVTPQDEAAFEGELEVLASRMSIPAPGEVILVRYDPANHRHIAPARDIGAVSLVQDVRPNPAALAVSMSSGRTGALADQLHELEDMHRSGSLTEQEFRLAKKKLLA